MNLEIQRRGKGGKLVACGVLFALFTVGILTFINGCTRPITVSPSIINTATPTFTPTATPLGVATVVIPPGSASSISANRSVTTDTVTANLPALSQSATLTLTSNNWAYLPSSVPVPSVVNSTPVYREDDYYTLNMGGVTLNGSVTLVLTYASLTPVPGAYSFGTATDSVVGYWTGSSWAAVTATGTSASSMTVVIGGPITQLIFGSLFYQFTPTPTNTFTVTPGGPTNTFTSIPTATRTPTVAITSTPTVTRTNTNTPTVTNTQNGSLTTTFTSTRTSTAGATSTPTVTPTPSLIGCPPDMIDDFEDGDDMVCPGSTGNWSGTWYAGDDGSSPVTFELVPGCGGSNHAGHFYTSGPVTEYANLTAELDPTQFTDLSAYTGIVFDVSTDSSVTMVNPQMFVGIGDSDTVSIAGSGSASCTTCGDYHRSTFCLPAPGAGCQPVTIFFNQLSQSGWGGPLVTNFDPSQAYAIQFDFPTDQTMGVKLDNIRLTTDAPPAALGNMVISDFETGGKSVNSNLTGYLAGNTGFTESAGNSGNNGVLLSPMIDCGGDGSKFAAHLDTTWQAIGNYSSVNLDVHLDSGQIAPNSCDPSTMSYFTIPPSSTGIEFDMKVVHLDDLDGGPAPYLDFSIGTANTLPACDWEGGSVLSNDCNDSGGNPCGDKSPWDNFSLNNYNSCSAANNPVALPSADGTWYHVQAPWTAFARQGWGDPGSTAYPDSTCGWSFDWKYVNPPTPLDPANGFVNQSCYNNQVMFFSWAAGQVNGGTPDGNHYQVEFWVDNVDFY